MRNIIIGASALLVSSAIVLQGCDQTQQSPARSVNNISEKPLYLKDLTTGVKYEEAQFPKLVTSVGNKISFDYSFFGKDKLIYAELDSARVIYAYEILLKGDLGEVRQAIEDKVSAENGKKVKFSCETENATWGGLNWLNKNCSIVSGTQRLLLKETKPNSRKPASVSDEAWRSMHLSSVLLEDVELSKQAKQKADDEVRQKHEANKAKAQKDAENGIDLLEKGTDLFIQSPNRPTK